jgi:hypothetical protein
MIRPSTVNSTAALPKPAVLDALFLFARLNSLLGGQTRDTIRTAMRTKKVTIAEKREAILVFIIRKAIKHKAQTTAG